MAMWLCSVWDKRTNNPEFYLEITTSEEKEKKINSSGNHRELHNAIQVFTKLVHVNLTLT